MKIKYDLTGNKFNKLTVNKPLCTNYRGDIVWECTCECGETRNVITYNLRKNKVKSCKTCTRSTDLTGNKFGNLTVIKRHGKEFGVGLLWKCLCDCGNEKVISSGHLLSGMYKSCGCSKRYDLLNKKIGLLTVIEESGKDQYNNILWKCICSCGGSTVLSSTQIVNKRTKSCGCYRSKDKFETIKNSAFRTQIKKAEDRGYDWFLSRDDYLSIVSKPCVYCGKFSIRKNRKGNVEMQLNSVDRRNNEPYYKLENCQSTCFYCNSMKNDKTHDEFIAHIKDVATFINLI